MFYISFCCYTLDSFNSKETKYLVFRTTNKKNFFQKEIHVFPIKLNIKYLCGMLLNVFCIIVIHFAWVEARSVSSNRSDNWASVVPAHYRWLHSGSTYMSFGNLYNFPRQMVESSLHIKEFGEILIMSDTVFHCTVLQGAGNKFLQRGLQLIALQAQSMV